MLRKINHQNVAYCGPAPEGTLALEREGHYLLEGEYSADEVAELVEDIERVYRRIRPDRRWGRPTRENAAMFRYEMFNRSALCQRAIARPNALAILEPLLGEDCHVISCTAWRNPRGEADAPNGLEWHVDGGPHVPRPAGTEWPAQIPYPIFVVATHLWLREVTLADGPTSIIPGSHTSGGLPPSERSRDPELTHGGRGAVHHLARPGDVSFFVSDVWHRRLPPAPESRGRFFLQTNYGRREAAQRVRPTQVVNHARRASIRRARTERERQLIGIHPQAYYDS